MSNYYNTRVKSKKNIFVIILVTFILLFGCVNIALWGVINLFFPDKIISTTIGVTTLDNVIDDSSKDIMTINYYSNHNGNGLEMFEVKLNGYINDNQINNVDNAITYAKGVQLVGDKEGSILDTFTEDCYLKDFAIFSANNIIQFMETSLTPNYYDLQNGISFNSINSIDDCLFKISLDNQLYGMKLKGIDSVPIDERSVLWTPINQYIKYDVSRLVGSLLKSVINGNLKYGTSGYLTISLGSMFDFTNLSKGNGNGWLTNKTEEGSKICNYISEYFRIKFNISESGVTNSNQSLFGAVNGQFNYSTNFDTTDYLYGEQFGEKLSLNEYNFNYTKVEGQTDNTFALSLNDKTVNYLRENEDVKFKININLDNLSSHFIIAYGFLPNSSLAQFKDRITSITLSSNNATWGVKYDTIKF